MADGSLSNIGAWVAKKVPELVGMEEPDLVEFIMSHVRQHALSGELGQAGVGRTGHGVPYYAQRVRQAAHTGICGGEELCVRAV